MSHRTLIVAEKPSVARDLARVLGVKDQSEGCIQDAHYTITWCYGHLVELVEPAHYDPGLKRWTLDALPIIPSRFTLQPTESGKAQYERLARWLHDASYTRVINACDAGREGELIFGYVYELARSTLPVERLWIASLTDDAIKEGMARLQPGQAFETLYQSARARSQADWLVGLNATRLITLMSRLVSPESIIPVLSVGRVQTPTLALVVSRDEARDGFTPTTTWGLRAQFCTLKGHHYEGLPQDEHHRLVWASKAEAESYMHQFDTGARACVTAYESKESKRASPQFFDLTSLQRDANVRHGFSAQHTLDLAQALYERHKLLTYPRTDSRHITADIARTLISRLKAVRQDALMGDLAATLTIDVTTLTKRLVNAEKVSDHHAILPTTEVTIRKALSPDERTLYEMVCRRTMAALAAPACVQHTTLTTTWGELGFVSRGAQLMEPGWMTYEKELESHQDTTLPAELVLDAKVSALELRTQSSTTKAPARLTEASLLRAMETVGKSLDDDDLSEVLSSSGGLGTPATRASTIETLLARGYMVRSKKSLVSTPVGRSLIHALSAFPSLTSAQMTGNWEQALEWIVEDKLTEADFMQKAAQLITNMDNHFKAHPPKLDLPERESLGACPACRKKLFFNDKAMWCEGGSTRSCDFYVNRAIAGKKLTKNQLIKLAKTHKTSVLKGFKSRKGDAFEAALALTPQDNSWKVKFVFEDKPKPKARARSTRA